MCLTGDNEGMPLFEYDCKSCSNRFELLVRGNEPPQCPACQGTALERRLSVFAAHVNGASRTADAPVACGHCGDPRGAGACSLN